MTRIKTMIDYDMQDLTMICEMWVKMLLIFILHQNPRFKKNTFLEILLKKAKQIFSYLIGRILKYI